MRKIVYINACNYGSTGSIIRNLASMALTEGFKPYLFFPKTKNNIDSLKDGDYLFGNIIARNIDAKLCEFSGNLDSLFYEATYELLHKLDEIKPDLIHIHNLHGGYINYTLLFNYIKKKNIAVIWTLHDCWSFTGRCPHFLISNCSEWKHNCEKCNYSLNDYPKAKRNKSQKLLNTKREAFGGVKNLTIVTPSTWLSKLLSDSILEQYPVQVINNGIDTNIFQRRNSYFKEKMNIKKYLVLGVSLAWSYKKGLDVFVALSQHMGDDYSFVIVGINKELARELPDNIITIEKTNNPIELAEIYSSADVFINPTREDNYPTVNLEALSCGCPVVTFNTGGSSEMLDESCGRTVLCGDVEAMKKCIQDICEGHNILTESCINKASLFKKSKCFQQYIDLYNSIFES